MSAVGLYSCFVTSLANMAWRKSVILLGRPKCVQWRRLSWRPLL